MGVDGNQWEHPEFVDCSSSVAACNDRLTELSWQSALLFSAVFGIVCSVSLKKLRFFVDQCLRCLLFPDFLSARRTVRMKLSEMSLSVAPSWILHWPGIKRVKEQCLSVHISMSAVCEPTCCCYTTKQTVPGRAGNYTAGSPPPPSLWTDNPLQFVSQTLIHSCVCQ